MHELHIAWDKANLDKRRASSRKSSRKRRARKLGNIVHFTPQEFEALKRQLGYRCVDCWKTEEELKLEGRTLAPDHIVSLEEGGLDCIENIQPLCHSRQKGSRKGCNNKKGKKNIDYLIS
jgi:hypothetical protein